MLKSCVSWTREGSEEKTDDAKLNCDLHYWRAQLATAYIYYTYGTTHIVGSSR